MKSWVLALCVVQVSAGWDVFGIGHKAKKAADELVNKLTTEFVPALKQAVNDEIGVIFDEKVPAMIEEANKAMADLVDHAEEKADELMQNTIGNITELVENTINLAGKMVDHTVEEVKEALDDFVDVHVQGLVDHVFADLNDLLTRVEQDVQQFVCEEEGILKEFQIFIDQKTDVLDCGCVLQVKNAWAQPCECTCSDKLPTIATCHCSPSSWVATEDQLSFEYIQCQQRKAIESGELPVDKIVTLLDGLRTTSEQLRCYHLEHGGTGGTTLEYTSHVLNISKEMYIWRHVQEMTV